MLVVGASVVCEMGYVCRVKGASVLGVATVAGAVCGVVVAEGAVVAGDVLGGVMVPHPTTHLVVGGAVVGSVVTAAAMPAPRGEPVMTLTTNTTPIAARAASKTATTLRRSIATVSRPRQRRRTALTTATVSSHNGGSVITSPAKISPGFRGSGRRDRLAAITWSQ